MGEFSVLSDYQLAIRGISALREAAIEATVADGEWRIAAVLPKRMQPSAHERMILAAAEEEARPRMEHLLPASAVGRRGFSLSCSVYRYVQICLDPPGMRRNRRDCLIDDAISFDKVLQFFPFVPALLALIPEDPRIDGSEWMVRDRSPWVLHGPADVETAVGTEMASSSLSGLLDQIKRDRFLSPRDFVITRNTLQRLEPVSNEHVLSQQMADRIKPLLPSATA